MKQILKYITILLLLSAIPFSAWLYYVFEEAIPYTVTSKALNSQRDFWVYLPRNYDSRSGNTYPVLYTLDGERERNKGIVHFILNLLRDNNIIIVAISTKGTRSSDLAPKAVDTPLSKFLITEVRKHVERDFNTSGKHMLAGHSMGGLYTVRTFINNPNAFNTYYAFSPTFSANPDTLVELKNRLLKGFEGSKSLYMNIGNERRHNYRELHYQAQDIIEANAPRNLKYKINRYPLPHSLIMLPGYFQGNLR